MGTLGVVVGVRLEDHNHLKYYISLTRVGTELLAEVFTWGYTGGSEPLKDVIFRIPGYSNTKYQKDFNASQRERINNGAPVSSFDITLIYKLLQMVCGLKKANDPIWITEASDSLEHCFYSIKTKRNEVAHESLQLTPTELSKKLDKLRKLFVKTINKAEQKFSVDPSQVCSLLNSINSQLDAIRDSPVPLTTVAEYEKELLANRIARAIDEGGKESTQKHKNVCQVSVAPWLIAGQTVNVSQVFTHPRLKRAETQILQRQLSAEESYVSVSDILQATDCDGTRPDVTLISALSGMGKSYLLKYILDKRISDQSALPCTDSFDLVLFLDCRHTTFSSTGDLMELLLPQTAALFQPCDFKQTLLSLNLLLLLDDVDALDQKSFSIFQEFLRVASLGTKIIATSSREKAKDLQRKVSALNKNTLFLEIEGIPQEKILSFLQQTLQYVLPKNAPNQDSEAKLCKMVMSKLPQLQEHLRSPEILGLLALSWALAPDRINSSATVTEIFMLVEDLLIHKVLQNLSGQSLPGISAQNTLRSNLQKYLISLSGVAASCLRKGKFSIESKGVSKLVKDCQRFGLPDDYMIPAFLNYSDEPGSGSLSGRPNKVSFPRRSALQYYTAWSIIQTMKDAPASKTLCELLDVQITSLSEVQISSLQAMMKYLVGMLAALLPEQLAFRATEIVELLKDLRVTKSSQWLQFIEESKEEKTITQEILKVMDSKWEVEDFAISSSLVEVIRKTKPQQLVLTTVESPQNYPHLYEVLKICAESPQMRLSLHLYKHFWSEKVKVSDEYLDTITQVASPCTLEHFAGRLSTSAITRLPKTLKRLALHITTDMMNPLNSALPMLNDLQMLYLNLDISAVTDPNTLPSLNIVGRPIILSVDMWRITKDTVEWACDVTKVLSKTYTRLVLRHCDLDACTVEQWVAGLGVRGVTVSSLVVGSTTNISDEENSILEQSATKIGCRQFVRIKI